MRPRLATLVVLAGLLATARASAQDAAAPPSLRVAGDVAQGRGWTTADLAQTFAADLKEIPWTYKEEKHVSRSVPLLAVVQAARLALDPAKKHHDLAFAVAVRARDGYTATFSYAELDPALRGTEAWIALDDNGTPLSDRDAPAGLLATNDGKHSRWVRGIDGIFVIDTTKVLPK
jgi:hypothetical protein